MKLDGLFRQIYVSLDIFHNVMQNKDIETPLEAWLMALTTRDLERIDELIQKFPEFSDIYREIFEFRTKPEELIHMYLKALAETDRCEERMMIQEMQDTITEQSLKLSQKDHELSQKDHELQSLKSDIAQLQEELRSLKADL